MNRILTAMGGLLVLTAGAIVAAPVAQATTTVASAPIAVRGTPGNLTATIFWAPPTSNGGSPITSYHLYANGVSKEVSPSIRRWTFTHLRAGYTYKLYVSARNAKGRSLNATALVRVFPAVKKYANCTEMNKVYRHGVGRSSTVIDRTSGVKVVDFYVSKALYDLNVGSDRDRDRIACEKL